MKSDRIHGIGSPPRRLKTATTSGVRRKLGNVVAAILSLVVVLAPAENVFSARNITDSDPVHSISGAGDIAIRLPVVSIAAGAALLSLFATGLNCASLPPAAASTANFADC